MTIVAQGSPAYDASGALYASNPNKCRCFFAIIREADGSFTVDTLNLPGVVGCGDTEEAAVDDACDAVRAALESYSHHGEDVPWLCEGYDIPEGAKLRWVLVDAGPVA